MRIALVVVIALVLSHCRPAGPADRGEIGASIVNELPQPPEEEEQPSIKREKVEIQLDTVKNEVEELAMVEVFPEEDTPFGNVLTSGEFHKEEIPDDATNSRWLGLFLSANGSYYTKTTTLITSTVFDPVMDADESDPSGIKISTPEADSVIILVQGMGDLQSGAVDFIADFPKVILPDESFEFTYKDHFYRLFARGEKEQIGGQWYTTRNYELFLERDQEERITLLSSFPYFDDSEIVLLFIGDIDQDGGIDLIIDNSPKYNSFSPTLYLSGFVEGDVLVKPVGMSHFFGC